MSKPQEDVGEVAAQASGAGLTTAQVRSVVASGVGTRRWREVFTVAGAPPSYEADVMVACLAGGPQAMACRGTVARLLGIARPYFDEAGIEITVPRGASTRAARSLGATVHVRRGIADADRGRVGPIPATSAARLVVDLLDVTPVEALYAAADDVLQRRWTTPDAIRNRWMDARAFHRDVLEAVLLPWAPGPKPGSPKEMSLCRVLQLHGLPRPARQHPVWIPGRRQPRYLDLAYPEVRIAPEYDGRREHGVRRWDHDAAREDELASVGWVRLPAGRSDLIEPGATVYCDEVRAAVRARSGAA